MYTRRAGGKKGAKVDEVVERCAGYRAGVQKGWTMSRIDGDAWSQDFLKMSWRLRTHSNCYVRRVSVEYSTVAARERRKIDAVSTLIRR